MNVKLTIKQLGCSDLLRKKSILLLLFFIVSIPAFAQQVLTGKVNDIEKKGLPGVSIKVKGTPQGTTTDNEGRFKLNVPANAVLVFSYIGYVGQEIALNGKTSLEVLLQEATDNKLDEIVVVGYGTKKRANLTGAISTISGAELAKSPATNLTNSIAGQVPGLIANTRSGEPGNDNADIFVRGKSTLGSSGALIVIDGIPDRAGGFARLNPADIESFTVIKDASGAIYGARSANGVILITTKRGKAGTSSISFGTNWGLTQPTRVPKMLNSYEYAIANNEYNALRGEALTWKQEDIDKFRDGSDPLGHPSTNWWDAIMKKRALQQNHIISLNGGTEKVKYFLSGQYQKQDGIYKRDAAYYEQAQGRANVDIAVTDNFKVGVDVSYRNEFRNAAKRGYDAAGIFRELWLAYPYLIPQYDNGLVGVGIGGGPDNSLLYITSGEAGYQRFTTNYLQTKTSFNWNLSKITDGLYLDGYYAYDLTSSKNKAFTKATPPAFRYNPATQDYTRVPSSISPSLYEQRGNLNEGLLNVRVGYSKKIKDHSIDAFAAFEKFNGAADTISATRVNYISNNLDQLSAGSLIGQQNGSTAAKTARVNFIGRISYNFKNKYLLDYNMRYDGSQNFPETKRYGFFPGISAGWRISQEDFFKSSVINELKLRASWGRTGNDRISAFNYLQTYILGTGYGYSFGPGASQASSIILGPTPNPNITWEIANTTDIALESQFFKGKLSASVDYFRSMRSNILVPRSESVPGYTGLVLPNENLGKVLSRGLEFETSFHDNISTDLSYNVRGNITYAKNKVIFMDEAPNVPSYQKKTNLPLDSWLLYQSDGIYQNQKEIDNSPHVAGAAPGDVKYKDINGDGVINDLDMVRSPITRTPEIMFGFGTGFAYKGIDFSVFFQGQARARAYLAPAGLNIAKEFFDDRWQKEGDNIYPRNFSGPTGRVESTKNRPSDIWLRNAAFVRLKNIEVGYTLPKSITDKIKIQNARFYINGTNLFSIDKFGPSFDPETPNDSGQYYPIQRVVNIGANITF